MMILSLVLLYSISFVCSEDDVIVKIEQGKLRGLKEEDTDGNQFLSYQGIPYAKAPIGKLRFKDPEEPEKWNDEIFNATSQAPSCLSLPVAKNSKDSNGRQTLKLRFATSEDCLFINVFTREILKNKSQSLKAVMFYIYGGGFTTGSSSRILYGPEHFMTQDIVLVTFNYRVGPLGFLTFKDPSLGPIGNAGIKDMIQALKWVKKNIRKFGGDPNRVTIFGGSSGAASVEYLTLSPLATGLFHEAIMQSGSALNPWALGTGNPKPLVKVMNYTGPNDDKSILTFLQNSDPKTIFEAAMIVDPEFTIAKQPPFSPSIETKSEKALFSDFPKNILLSGNYNKVPMIIGHTSLEGLIVETFKFAGISINTEESVPYNLGYEKFGSKYNETMNKLAQHYFGPDGYDKNNKDAIYKVVSELAFVRGIYESIRIRSKTSSQPIYVYKMSADSDLNIFKKLLGITHSGVCHGDDVGYLFKTFSSSIDKGSLEDTLFRRHVKMWANFAKTGDPTPDSDPLLDVEWKPITSQGDMMYLEIGNDLMMKNYLDYDSMRFLDLIFGNTL